MAKGERILLDGSKPAFRPCRYCGGHWGITTGPVGPHENGVICEECGRHIGWMRKTKRPDPDLSLIED